MKLLADESISIPFVVGETVKVIDGPFNSFNAEIETLMNKKKKLKLIVKIFGRKTPLVSNFHASRKNLEYYKNGKRSIRYHKTTN